MKELHFSIELSDVLIDLTVWENNFKISRLQQHQNLPTQLKAIHRHSSFEMFIVPDSSLCVHTPVDSLSFRDSIVIIPPTLNHFASFDGACGYYLYFSVQKKKGKESEYAELMSYLSRGVTSLSMSDDERFYAGKIDLTLQSAERSYLVVHLLALFFSEVLSKLLPKHASSSPTQTKYGKYTNTVDLYLGQHYTEAVRLSSLAQELYLCPKQVSRILKSAYGCSLSELINQRRLEASCLMLKYTDLEISEIAKQVGYEHENYFFTLFKKRYGTTPKQYRDQKRADGT